MTATAKSARIPRELPGPEHVMRISEAEAAGRAAYLEATGETKPSPIFPPKKKDPQ